MQGKLKDMIAEKGNTNKDIKIFMGHGDADQMVKHEWGKLSSEKLKEWGYDVDFRTYPYALFSIHLIGLGFIDLNLAALHIRLIQRKLTTLRLSSTRQYLPWRRNKAKEAYDSKAARRWI